MKRVCEVCKKECVGRLIVLPGVTTGAHPKCAVRKLVEGRWLPYRGITKDIATSPKFLAVLESIAEDPTRGRPLKRRRYS